MLNDQSPRRFRFGLRTLFVMVTLVSMTWVAYSMNWIRERRAINSTPAGRFIPEHPEGKFFAAGDARRPPGGLWIFGENGYEMILYFPPIDQQEIERASRLYPEATLINGGKK